MNQTEQEQRIEEAKKYREHVCRTYKEACELGQITWQKYNQHAKRAYEEYEKIKKEAIGK